MIALIDYDAGNTCSVMNALDRLNADYRLTDDAALIQSADKVIFPGVGHAGAAMEALKKKQLVDVIRGLTQPVLGICVGMQLMASFSEEGETSCLNIIPGTVKKFDASVNIKVPHMGWNKTGFKKHHPLFEEMGTTSYFYYVHSYYFSRSESTIATCTYGDSFAAAIQKDNFLGIQFHAEKSGRNGERLLQNFIKAN